jgi:O-acetyl-ADP-ribose deacetylase (regulator of RNase III)
MIAYITGNIFESPAQALVNTVNTVGIMGKGIALQFKKEFPKNYRDYAQSCKNGAFFG